MRAYRTICIAIAIQLLLGLAQAAWGFELPEFYRGVRAMGMGNAFTAVADDADSVFYNPAGMALNKRFEFRPINPKFDLSADPIDMVRKPGELGGKLDGATISKLFGKHFYGSGTVFPALHFPYVTIGYFYQAQGHLIMRNLAFPKVEATYLRDYGLVGGVAYETRGFSRRHYARYGVAVKWLTRQGFQKTIPVTDLVTADRTYFSRFGNNKGDGVGLTLGIQYDIPINRSNDLILGSAWQDVGDTEFGKRLDADRPPNQQNNLSAGFALVHRFSSSFRAVNNIKFAAEMRHIAQAGIDPRLKAHVGVELQIYDISVQAGLNQDSFTAGAKLDMGFFDVAAVTYGSQQQSLAFMDRERRYMLQLGFKFDVWGQKSRTMREEDRRKRPREY